MPAPGGVPALHDIRQENVCRVAATRQTRVATGQSGVGPKSANWFTQAGLRQLSDADLDRTERKQLPQSYVRIR